LRRFEHAIDQQNREVDSETLAVQNLAETSERSDQNQLHFIVASLEGFASASTKMSSGQASKAIERLGGRFNTYTLMTQGSEELIRGAIQRLPCGDQMQIMSSRQRDDLMEIAESLWRPEKNRAWIRDVIIDGAFPLHPLSTFALPLINQRVAQSQRTMFLFLNDKQGLQGFLQRETLASSYPGWSNLLTLDRLFDYFDESIAVRRSDVTDAYAHSLQQMKNATVDTTLALCILKVVALCEVIAPALSPTRALLRHALNLPPSAEEELSRALDILEQTDAIFPPNDERGSYSLPMPGRVNAMSLRRRITQRAQPMPTNVQRLQAAHPAEPIMADSYNRRRGSQRGLVAFYVGLNDLSSPNRLKTDLEKADEGLLWYVVASSETERSTAQNHARELTRQNKRLVIAVPNISLRVLDALRDHDALVQVRHDPDLDGTARTYLEDAGRVGKGYRDALDAALAAMREERQWEWFVGGISQTAITSRAQAQELASKLMVEVFPNTPEHQLGQHFKPEGLTPALKRAVGEIIKGALRLGKNSSQENIILRNGVVALGLLKLDKVDGAFEVYPLIEPSGNFNSKKIWQLFYEYLSTNEGWSKLLVKLRKPPYGLYDSLLLVFTAAFLTYHADSIEIASGAGMAKRSHAVDIDLLEKLIDPRQSYAVRLQPLTDLERQWLRGIVASGINRPFDPNGGRGTTLAARVADQVRSWIKRQQLPLFAEKLTIEQLQQFVPQYAPSVLEAVTLLLQANRNDFDLTGALLDKLPLALRAPTDHQTWTSETIDGLLNLLGETCRVVEQLPGILEEHATARIAALFGCEQDAPENRWGAIYQWRGFRKVVQPDKLSSPARNLFLYTNNPSGTIKTAFLEEFAKNIVGLNTDFQRWPTLDSLNRLEQELQKSKREVDEKWKDLAPKEEVWLGGLSQAALGRPVIDKSADKAAKHLAEWSKAISLPAYAIGLRPEELQRLYPEVTTQQCADISQILRRMSYSADEWQQEIVDTLAKQFGVQNWSSKSEVDEAVKRFGVALKHTANFDALLRRHILERMATLFAESASDAIALNDLLTQWRLAHPIPEQNDLSDATRILMQQIDGMAVAETTLLTTLPRALPEIGQAYQQWPNYQTLDRYITTIERAAQEIDAYIPLTEQEYAWLSGIITEGLGRPLGVTTREQRKLTQAVNAQLIAWMRDQNLPAFSASLSVDELYELYADATPTTVEAIRQLLRLPHTEPHDSADFLLRDLPATLGIGTDSATWIDADVEELITRFGEICRRLSALNDALTQLLYKAIGMAFGVDANGGGAPSLLARLHVWREEHVLFPGETLSPDAATVFSSLQSVADDPRAVLLTTLPDRLKEVRAPYDCWTTWSDRERYIQSLEVAAAEIKKLGQVGEATPRVRALWEGFKQQIDDLSVDERRWLIKIFDEEFHV